MDKLRDTLLLSDQWPEMVRRSVHYESMVAAASLAQRMEELTNGGPDLDEALRDSFAQLRTVAPWLPKVAAGRPPAYTRRTWDLRALVAMVPKGLQLEIEQDGDADDEGFIRWHASLFDAVNSRSAAHPSDLEHNSILTYESRDFGEAWTPNIALGRILLAAYLLAAHQRLRGVPGAGMNAGDAIGKSVSRAHPALTHNTD